MVKELVIMPFYKEVVNQLINPIWDKYDPKNTGFVDNHIALQMFKEIEARGGKTSSNKEIKVLIDEVDENKDQKISKEEFTEFIIDKLAG